MFTQKLRRGAAPVVGSILGLAGLAYGSVVTDASGTLSPVSGRTIPTGTISPALAQPTSSYSDITTFSGYGESQGAASTGTTRYTSLVLDDVTPSQTASNSYIRFTVSNSNTSNFVLGTAAVRIFDSDGASGGPGSFLYGYNFTFNATLAAATTYTIQSAALSTPIATTAGHTLWMGVFYNNSGSASSTKAANVGQGLYNPVDVGSSLDQAFYSTAFGTSTSDFTSNVPAGTVIAAPYSSISVPADLGLEISTLPEPASLSLFAVGGLGLLARRRQA